MRTDNNDIAIGATQQGQIGRRAALIGAAGAGVAGAGVLLSPGASAQTAPKRPAVSPASPRTLASGMSGADVKAMQTRLLALRFWHPGADGVFGYGTKQAVWAFQKAYGLPRTGQWGPADQAKSLTAKRLTVRYKNVYRIEVDKTRQLMLVGWGYDLATWILNTSTGADKPFYAWGKWWNGKTPSGTWKIYRTQTTGWVTGALGEMYKPYYVVGGIAIHGSADIPAYNASHGCCRVLPAAQDMMIRSKILYPGRVVSIY